MTDDRRCSICGYKISAAGHRLGCSGGSPVGGDFIGAHEAANILRVHHATVTRWVESGRLKAHKLPGLTGALIFDRSDVEDLRDESALTAPDGSFRISVSIRLTPDERDALDAVRMPRESRSAAVRRLVFSENGSRS
jgi:excisionase family DNA binding protein